LDLFRSLFSRAAPGTVNTGLYSLRKNAFVRGFVSGHDFSRADKAFIF